MLTQPETLLKPIPTHIATAPSIARSFTRSKPANGFIEALNGLFQAAKRKARGYTRFATMRTVLFLIAGKLDFTRLNPDAA
jgi:hypothetical protein